MNKPGQFTAMISATAFDLPVHREKVQEACLGEEVFPLWMKHLPTRDAGGVRVSLEMVDKADIYIGVYAWRYGWVPDFDNPDKISITEMEFNRALQRKAEGKLQEILIFIVHDDHPPARASDIEIGEEAQRKLKAFKDRASEGRNRGTFISSDELGRKVTQALAAFVKRAGGSETKTPTPFQPESDSIPAAPALYAAPDYIGSHQFVGRDAELQTLNDWANPADPTNLLLFEAIGGNGKSMLTWEWTTKHASNARSDWAGRFWYSFYERGAIMQDFCRRALAYMTGRSLKEFEKRKTADMKEELIAQLHAKPWLLILDGLERVLVAYHRIDAAEVPDEEADTPTDKVLNRNPCDAINDEDNDLLRAFSACAPSKILVSSRLTPRVLLNPAGQPIPSVHRITLPGLRPSDAEKLLRSCGISGDKSKIQDYLRQNCDNHPLVIGVLAGIINGYMLDRGNFDTWVADEDGGAGLSMADLPLVWRRNHILLVAIASLPDSSRQLLSTLALLSDSVDYQTLKVFNPHLPPQPEAPDENMNSVQYGSRNKKTDDRKWHNQNLADRKKYEKELKEWLGLAESRDATNKLAETIRDLEQRGLLQYHGRERRYDLHPVVRGVAAGGMNVADKERYGQRVLDHFSSQAHSPYENAKTWDDVSSGVQVVRTLVKLGRFQQAAEAYRGRLASALLFNLEGHAETLSLLRPFFGANWGELPRHVTPSDGADIANDAAGALETCGEPEEALAAYGSVILSDLAGEAWWGMNVTIRNISGNLSGRNMFAKASRVNALGFELAKVRNRRGDIFMSRLWLFDEQSRLGRWEQAKASWDSLDTMGRHWARTVYRQGDAEYLFALWQFWQGSLNEMHLATVHMLALKDNNRRTLRDLHSLRGKWKLELSDWQEASTSFHEAIRMARERRLVDADSETGLSLAKFRLGLLTPQEARTEAEYLSRQPSSAPRTLAMLWLAIGDQGRSKDQALAAYNWAWADGEPFVHRYELTKATDLLHQMNVTVPDLPPYDPAMDGAFPWEADVRAAIERLRTEEADVRAAIERLRTENEAEKNVE